MKLSDVGGLESCLFKEFATGSVFGCLVYIEKAAWECPPAFVGFYTAFYEQDVKTGAIETEYHAVGGDTGMGVLVMIV